MNREHATNPNGQASQFEVNARDLNKAAKAIRGHDVALRNVLEEINAFGGHLDELVKAQGSFTDGLQQVTAVQRRMAQAQADLSGALADVSLLADDKVPTAQRKLQGALDQTSRTLTEAAERLEGTLGQVQSVASGLDAEALRQLGARIEAALEGATASLATRVDGAVRGAEDEFGRRMAAVEAAAAGRADQIDAAANKVQSVAVRLDTAATSFGTRVAQLEQKMEQFQEQIERANTALDGRIREREEKLEEEKTELGKALTRIKNLFG